ncbi:MAG: hypothetical protein V3W04_11815 [Gammaproteobacteria bacterium]
MSLRDFFNSLLSYSYSYSPRFSDRNYGDTASDKYSPEDAGWRLLAKNKPRKALNIFSKQAQRNQKDGAFKVGYALSMAMLGNLNKATWAMRRAFRVDPESLHYIDFKHSLKSRMHRLIKKYEQRLDTAGYQSDAAFMIAALHYLLHDNDRAYRAIKRATDAHDNALSTKNLYRLIRPG